MSTYGFDTVSIQDRRLRHGGASAGLRDQVQTQLWSSDFGDVLRCAQVAALPIRQEHDGAFLVLLVTSRQSGRWIIPQGWPIKGLKGSAAA